MQMAAKPSSEYGNRLLPQIVDALARTDPDRIVYSIASFSEVSHEFRHISAKYFAQAIDKTAWWLSKEIGESKSIQAVGYIGPRKLRLVHWKTLGGKSCKH